MFFLAGSGTVIIMLYKDKRPLIIFLAPALLVMGIFLYYPFLKNIADSFFEIKGFGAMTKTYVGLDNYRQLFKDKIILQALKNTGIMVVFTIIFEIGMALVLALMVDSIKTGARFFRTVFFFPVVISATAIGLMFNLFYAYNGGLFNQILEKLGLNPVLWLSDEIAVYMLALPIVWQYVGFYFVIILTGLNSIPEDIYEHAYIDGVEGLKKVWYISLPLVWDVLKSCFILGITGTLKIFDLAWVIAPYGAPKGITHFFGTYLYQTTFFSQTVGYGSAIAVLVVVLGLFTSFAVMKLVRGKAIYYGGDI
jgi:raffinose/stachyose/melibiose transport system permease protein